MCIYLSPSILDDTFFYSHTGWKNLIKSKDKMLRPDIESELMKLRFEYIDREYISPTYPYLLFTPEKIINLNKYIKFVSSPKYNGNKDGENKIKKILKRKYPSATILNCNDKNKFCFDTKYPRLITEAEKCTTHYLKLFGAVNAIDIYLEYMGKKPSCICG